jgi:hypothetical protein
LANEEVNYNQNQNQSGNSSNNLLMMCEGRIATFYWDCLGKALDYIGFSLQEQKEQVLFVEHERI